MAMVKRVILRGGGLVGALLAATTALAQAPEDPAAKDFLAGEAAESRGQLDEACGHYRSSLEKRRVPGPLTGSARCDAREQHYLAALAKLDEALAMLPPDHQQRASFEADRAAWKAKLARLTLSLKPGASVRSVTVDGSPMAPRPEPYELDPGQHVVRTESASGAAERQLVLVSGQTSTLELPFADTGAPADVGGTQPAADAGMSGWMTAAIVSFSVAGAGVVATAVTGVMVLDRDSTAEALCTPTKQPGCDQAIDDGKALLAPNLAMWIVSGVAVAAGVSFVIVDATTSGAPAATSRVELHLLPSGLALSGSF